MFVGASGGGDSTALLVLLAEVARAQGRRLIAGIVDHALRDGSAIDAEHAAHIAASVGADARVLRLTWEGVPKTGQASARTARYAALARMAREIGAGTLFLGHTLDDQAETLLMRAEAGSGAHGMAGMAPLCPCPIWPEAHDLQLARPLLRWRRAVLRDLLRARDINWIEDPANALSRFARVRVRARLVATDGVEALAASADASSLMATNADLAARALLLTNAVVEEADVSLKGITADTACVRALSVLATAVGGAAREPSPAAAARLAARLMAGQHGTLAGARFQAGAIVRVTRDPGGVLGRRGGGVRLADLPLPMGGTVIWDGRLALTATAPGWTATVSLNGTKAPELRRGGERRMLADAPVAARWLVALRIERLLWRAGA